MFQRVKRLDAEGVCTLTLERPEKLNALDTLAFQELDAHLTALQHDEGSVGCVVLRGAGKGFCAVRAWACSYGCSGEESAAA